MVYGAHGEGRGEQWGGPLSLLPDKGEEKQGPQNSIERDECDEVAYVITEGPDQVLGRERRDYVLQTMYGLPPPSLNQLSLQ